MNPWILKIRKAAKTVIAYSIEGEYKVYRLKHTPFRVKKYYTGQYHKLYDAAEIVPNKIVFDNYMGKGFGCNGKYVAEKLLAENKDYDIVWTVKNVSEQRKDFPSGIRLVEYGSKEAMAEYATAGIWVQNYQLVHYLNKGLLKKPGQTYIQMWHGSFGIKKIENNCDNLTSDKNWTILAKKNSEYTDYWISNSRFETEVYKKAFWNVDKVLEYGHPRNDIFFSGEGKKIREQIDICYGTGARRIFLYVPTFRDEGMTWEQTLDYGRLKDSLDRRFGGEWQIFVRIHPRMREFADRLIPREDYITDVTEYPDIQELLAAADAVGTDYSSAVFDFLLTGKPAFLYVPDYRSYEGMRGLYYPLEDTPFPIAVNNWEMEKNIQEFDEEAYRRKAETFLRQKGSVEDGKAAERTAALIREIAKRKESKI